MQFTYESYVAMLKELNRKGYRFKNYHNWHETDYSVILRHDVDYDLEKAVLLSEMRNHSSPKAYRQLILYWYLPISTIFIPGLPEIRYVR